MNLILVEAYNFDDQESHIIGVTDNLERSHEMLVEYYSPELILSNRPKEDFRHEIYIWENIVKWKYPNIKETMKDVVSARYITVNKLIR